MNVFETYHEEIVSLATRRGGSMIRQTYNTSPLIARLRAEMEYVPPSPRGFPYLLDLAQQEAEHRVSQADEPRRERVRLRARHAELSALVDAQQRMLDEATAYTEVEEIASHMRLLEAALFLLAMIPGSALLDPEPAVSPAGSEVPFLHEHAIEVEVTKLRAWSDRLSSEQRRLRTALNDGDPAPTSAFHSPLWHELAAVVQGLLDAEENLRLAPRPMRLRPDPAKVSALADKMARDENAWR